LSSRRCKSSMFRVCAMVHPPHFIFSIKALAAFRASLTLTP
jgi:hypothetical protein